MEFLVLGSSGSSPVRGNPASGYLVTEAGTSIWCDAGPGTMMQLLDVTDPGSLDAVVITHTHLDHSTDFLGLYHYMEYGPSGPKPIPVFVPPGAADHFASYVRADADHPFWNVFDFRDVHGRSRHEIGDIRLHFAPAHHSVPAISVRFESGGSSLVYTGDTGPSEDVEALAAGADVLLAEASLQGSADESPYEFHLTAEGAARLAVAAGVGRLILTHLPPTLTVERTVAEAAEVWGRVPELAMPGMIVSV